MRRSSHMNDAPADPSGRTSAPTAPIVDLRIVSVLPDLEVGGPVQLADGTAVLLPPVPHSGSRNVGQCAETRQVTLQRTAYHLHLSDGVPLRGVIVDGMLAAITGPRPLVHAVDLAVLRAVGEDVDAAIAAFRDQIVWHVEPFEPTTPYFPQGFYTTIPENRLTSVADVDDCFYSDGVLQIQAEMPETMLASLIGRPLRDLVDLPSLRALDLTILSLNARRTVMTSTPIIDVGLCDDAGWEPVP